MNEVETYYDFANLAVMGEKTLWTHEIKNECSERKKKHFYVAFFMRKTYPIISQVSHSTIQAKTL
jgi:hypothetical protein